LNAYKSGSDSRLTVCAHLLIPSSLIIHTYTQVSYYLKFFPLKNHTVRDTPVSNQHYSYTIHVWLWYNLMSEGYDTKTFSLKKNVWWGTYRSLTQYKHFLRKSEKLKRCNYINLNQMKLLGILFWSLNISRICHTRWF